MRCALGTIAGLFFFKVETAHGGDYLLADRLILVDLFGSHRTLAAMLRATRELGEIHACREIRVLPPDGQVSPAAEGVAEVARRLGFMRGALGISISRPPCTCELLAQRQGAAHGETGDDVDPGLEWAWPATDRDEECTSAGTMPTAHNSAAARVCAGQPRQALPPP